MAFSPNEQQTAVLDFTRNNPGVSLNLIARAGTGKSTTLVWLAPQLEGTILMLAFNKSAAVDLENKLVAANVNPWKATSKTVHACGLRAFKSLMGREFIKTNGYKMWDLIDALGEQYKPYKPFLSKLVSLGKQAGIGFFTEIEDRSMWRTIIDHYGLEEDMPGGEGPGIESLIGTAQALYTQSLAWCRKPMVILGDKRPATIDFDDMLLAPLVFNARYEQYDNVLLDEAQDTNPVRRATAMASMKPGTGRLIAVGDPAQAIYGFTGANHDSLDLIKGELDSAELPLSVTYRCPKNIVAMAQKWVPDIEAHPSAPDGVPPRVVCLQPRDGEADFWGEDFQPDDVILCRNTRPLVELAYMFLRKRKPVRVEGRDIGEGLINLARKWKVKNLDALVEHLGDYLERETAKFQAKGAMMKAAALEDKVETLLCLIDSCIQEGRTRLDDVIELITNLFNDSNGERQRCLTLSTVHKAKGREWNRVYALGRDQFMPSKWAKRDWEKQQERNLQYVLVTRVKRELVDVIVPAKFGSKK